MKRAILVLAATGLGGAAQAAIPQMNATCPGGIGLDADDGGYVYINGTEAKLTMNEGAFDATLGSTTVMVFMNPDGSVMVLYTEAGGANGTCAAEVFS